MDFQNNKYYLALCINLLGGFETTGFTLNRIVQIDHNLRITPRFNSGLWNIKILSGVAEQLNFRPRIKSCPRLKLKKFHLLSKDEEKNINVLHNIT